MSTIAPVLTTTTFKMQRVPTQKGDDRNFSPKKEHGEPITMLTAYDYPTALAEDQAGINSILVGDSLGMVVLGYQNTLPVTIGEMCRSSRRPERTRRQVRITIGDMPFNVV